MQQLDPYLMQAGDALDAIVHSRVMQAAVCEACPHYSTDLEAAKRVLTKLKSAFETSVVCGATGISKRPCFVRTVQSSRATCSIEVIAESLPLAICRLALLRI